MDHKPKLRRFAWIALVLILPFAFVSASIPGSGGSIQACYAKAGGALRAVETASACKSHETAIAWNQVGPQGLQGVPGDQGDAGPQGPPGPQGPAGTVSSTQIISASETGTIQAGNAHSTWTVDAMCPAGKVLFGGGGSAFSPSGGPESLLRVSQPMSFSPPGGAPVLAWRVTGALVTVTAVDTPIVVSAYAICSV